METVHLQHSEYLYEGFSKTWHQIGQRGLISIVMKLYGEFQKQKLKEMKIAPNKGAVYLSQ